VMKKILYACDIVLNIHKARTYVGRDTVEAYSSTIDKVLCSAKCAAWMGIKSI